MTLGVKRVALLLLDENSTPRVVASRGVSLHLPRILREATLVVEAVDQPGPIRVGIVAGDRTLGALVLHDDRTYRSHEIGMLLSHARHVASTIRRFASIAELRERVEHEEMLAGILAHDLRAPLAAILATAGAPVCADTARQAMRLRRIASSARRMKVMIDQLLDFTRIRMGCAIDIDPRETTLSELCSTVVSELEDANIHCTIDRTTCGDPRGVWDPDLQVLSNIVGNACAHGRGPVRVTIDGTDPDVVVLEVENEGAIPPDIMRELFVPFRNGKRSESSSGLGLGFYISKQIVEAHGGRLVVTSRGSTCTTCRATLPRVCPARVHARSGASAIDP